MRRRCASTRVLLLGLVCLPLAACGVAGGTNIAGRVQAAQDARARAATIRLIGQVVNAQAGAESIVLPVLYHVVVVDPGLAEQAGMSRSLLPLNGDVFSSSTLAAWQANVNEQLAAINRAALPTPLATTIADLIDQRRQTAADIARLSPVVGQDYTVETGLLLRMAQEEEALTSQLLNDPEAAAGSSTVQDLQLTVSLVARADEETPAYLPTVVLAQPTAADRAVWLQTWGAYQSAAAAADAGLRGPLGAAWSKIEQGPTNSSFGATVDPTRAPAATVDPASFVKLAATSQARTGALDQLLQQAVTRAIAAADAQENQAYGQVWSTAIVTGALIIGTLLLTLLAGRTLSRPLRRLAEEADRISEGDLVEISPGGTTEVRRAGEALQATSASLRRVEQQAAEMAAGRLDSPLLREAVPGPLGAAVHGSVRRIVEAIRQREALQSELAHQLAHDPLTALPNRAVALEHTEAALARSARAEQILGVLFVDLDGFKSINDAYGHAAGDRALQAVARRLRDCTRAGDAVCRLGGDEFLVVIEDADSELSIVETAHRTVEALSAPLLLGGADVVPGVSVGVAVAVDARSTADTLLAEAEAAVNRAKANGGRRIEVFNGQLRAALRHRADVERGIRDGLARQEFTLVYQPVVDVATTTVHSHEALIRWNRPGRAQVMPSEFIPVAESSGLIGDLGRWVLLEATAQVRRWTDELDGQGRLPSVAVNVSGRQLSSPQLLADVREALDRSGIAPCQLTLELTESVLVSDLTSIDQLHALKTLGVRVALDDFGTGYTSISQLGRFPVDVLKIDRSFIATLAASDTLVRTMIQVAHTFSLEVVAEGVEDIDQLLALRALGCDSVQGFLFSRPRLPDRLTRPGRVLPVELGAPVV